MRSTVILIAAAIMCVVATTVSAESGLELEQRELAIYAHRALFPKSLLHLRQTAQFGVMKVPRREVQETVDQCVSAVQASIQDELSDCAAIMGASNTYTADAAETPAAVTSSLNALCSSSCYKPYLNVMRNYAQCLQSAINGQTGGGAFSFDIFGFLVKFVEFMCTKNEIGDYCLVGMYDTANIGNSTVRLHIDLSRCTWYTNYGCCATSLINTYSQSFASWNYVFNLCGMSNVPACPRPNIEYQVLVVKIRIAGVVYSWIAQATGNDGILRANLLKDLSRLFKVPAGYIQIVSLESGSLIANVKVRGANDTATVNAQAAIAAALTDGSGATFPNLNSSLPAEAKSGSLTLDASASTVTQTTAVNQAGSAPVRAVVWSLGAVLSIVAVALTLSQQQQ